MKQSILFSERQRFKKIWIGLFLVGVNGIFVWGIIQQIIYKHPFGNNPMSDQGLIVTSILILLLSVLFANARLDTYITQDGIYLKFFPFHLSFKFYSWDSISKLYIRRYSPILEYGGWGIKRRNFKKGKAYIVSGNKGLQLEFINKKKLLIGTAQAEEMEKILAKMGKLEQK